MSASLYVAIKMAEAVIWLSCASFFFVKSFRMPVFHWIYPALGFGFLYFGLADAVEYITAGRLPWWLWAWKISGGLTLFGLLVTEDYVRRGAVALAPYRFVAAAFGGHFPGEGVSVAGKCSLGTT